MRVLLCPDKFKGSLTALEAAEALRAGFAEGGDGFECEIAPMADGGEGTAAAFLAAMPGEWVEAPAHDALGRAVTAQYAWFPEERRAVIEMSAASGIWRLARGELDPLAASTFGTGELMAHALAHGAERIEIALGGSATNDAGLGMAAALGWKFLDANDAEIQPCPRNFSAIARIVPPDRPLAAQVTALCDVDAPLLGPRGASRVFGPQKGASPAVVEELEQALARVADLCRRDLGADHRDTPGTGATGGLAFGLMTFCDARLERGFDVVARLLDLEKRIAAADLVVTGEGRIDAQSLMGKGPGEIARLAQRHGIPCIAFGGSIEAGDDLFDACLPICNRPMSLDEAVADAAFLLQKAAARAAALLRIPARR